MIKQTTCANCSRLVVSQPGDEIRCSLTGYKVPYLVDQVGRRVTFTKIPTSCPRADVIKNQFTPSSRRTRRNLDALKALRGE